MPSPPRWTAGSYLTHRFNPELGIGRVTAIEGRVLVVEFPRAKTTLRFAASAPALVGVDLGAGRPVRITTTSEETTIDAQLPDGRFKLVNGRTVSADALWPLELEGALLERLAVGDLDDVDDFVTRMNILHLLGLREAGGLGSFLGGRVRLFPHQLHVERPAGAIRCALAARGRSRLEKPSKHLDLNRPVPSARRRGQWSALTLVWLASWRGHQYSCRSIHPPADVRDFCAEPLRAASRSVVSLEMPIKRPE